MDQSVGMANRQSEAQIEKWRYPPSWFDRFSDWLEELPGPNALYYIALGIVLLLILVGVPELEGNGNEPITDQMRIYLALIIPFILGMAHYLDIAAGKAMNKLRHTFRLDEVSLEEMHYRITTLPARSTFFVSLAVVVLVHLPMLFSYEYLGITPNPRNASQITFFIIGIVFWWTFGFGAYHTVHQLWVVDRVYTKYIDVNLYRFGTMYALSTVTSTSSIAVIVAASLAIAVVPTIALQPIGIVVIAISVFLGCITFFWPLWGVHRIMLEEKERLDLECSERYESLLTEWHSKLDSRELGGSEDLNNAIQSVLTEKNEISKIPTWPWAPGTLRGWIAALFLPLAVWILQLLLERSLMGG